MTMYIHNRRYHFYTALLEVWYAAHVVDDDNVDRS